MKQVKITDVPHSDTGHCCTILRVRSSNQPPHTRQCFLLSCLHVFGLPGRGLNALTNPSQISSNGGSIANYTGLGGKLSDSQSGHWSYDVALAKIDTEKESVIAQRLELVSCDQPLYYLDEIPQKFNVHTQGGVKPATQPQILRGNYIKVGYSGKSSNIAASHRVLVKYSADTQPGDSGAPVFGEIDSKNVLLGMHIAGDTQNKLGYMLPATEFIRNLHRYLPTFKHCLVTPY